MQEPINLPLHPDTCSVDGWSTDERRVLREFAQVVARECEQAVFVSSNPSTHEGAHVNRLARQAIRARFGLEG